MTKVSLTNDDVKKVAGLIKIKIDDNEVEKYKQQLDTVLDYLEVFDELDTSNTKITSQVTGLTNVLREDKAEESLSNEEALKNAHAKKDGYFVVQRVVKK